MAAKKSTPASSSNYYLPEIYGGVAPKASAPTSTDSVYGGMSTGTRSGAFSEGAGTAPTPIKSDFAEVAKKEDDAYSAKNDVTWKTFVTPLPWNEPAKEMLKNVAQSTLSAFTRPVTSALADVGLKPKEDKDINLFGANIYTPDYTKEKVLTDAANIALTTFPYSKAASLAKAGASKAVAPITTARGAKGVVEGAEAATKAAAPKGFTPEPPTGGTTVNSSPGPVRGGGSPLTKEGISQQKYGQYASTGEGVGPRSAAPSPSVRTANAGQQFASVGGETTSRTPIAVAERQQGVIESIATKGKQEGFAPAPTKAPEIAPTKPAATTPKPTKTKTGIPDSGAPSLKTNVTTSAGGAAGRATGVMIGSQFINYGGKSSSGGGAGAGVIPDTTQGTTTEITSITNNKIGDDINTTVKREQGTKTGREIGTETGTGTDIVNATKSQTQTKSTTGNDIITKTGTDTIKDELPPKDEGPNKNKVPLPGGAGKSPKDYARIPYIP